MYAICKALAQFYQQDKAKAEGRWIFYENQFTAEDNAAIAETEKRIKTALQSSNGLPWHDDFSIENGRLIIHQTGALSALKAVIPGTVIGFKMQDMIIARCKAHGINFRRKQE